MAKKKATDQAAAFAPAAASLEAAADAAGPDVQGASGANESRADDEGAGQAGQAALVPGADDAQATKTAENSETLAATGQAPQKIDQLPEADAAPGVGTEGHDAASVTTSAAILAVDTGTAPGAAAGPEVDPVPAAEAMAWYEVISPLNLGGEELHGVGSQVQLAAKTAAQLLGHTVQPVRQNVSEEGAWS